MVKRNPNLNLKLNLSLNLNVNLNRRCRWSLAGERRLRLRLRLRERESRIGGVGTRGICSSPCPQCLWMWKSLQADTFAPGNSSNITLGHLEKPIKQMR